MEDYSIESLNASLKVIESRPLALESVDHHLDILESYECWTGFNLLIKEKIKREGPRVSDYRRLFRVQMDYLEDVALAADTCVELLKKMTLTYDQLGNEILDLVRKKEDFHAEAIVLDKTLSFFPEKRDKINCLERLCFIYEKKKYDTELLSQSFERLIDLDPRNIKALKYFKAVHFHHREYESVIDTLKALYEATSHPADKSRIAMEWASTHLYQMNQPEKAVKVIEKISHGSRLDTSTLSFEAHYQLRKWQKCYDILKECIENVSTKRHKAVLFFKLGEIKELLKDDDSAKEHFESALKEDPEFLEPIENLLDICVKYGDWQGAFDRVKQLEEAVTQLGLKEDLKRLGEKISQGFLHAG